MVGAERLGPLLPLRPRWTFKNALTSGAWRVSRIVEVDTKGGFVYLIGNGREEGENPYYTHLYRVKLDGTELTCLDPSIQRKRNHKRRAGGFNQSSSLSPTKKFVVTNSTRVDHEPFATRPRRCRQDGDDLEHTDLTTLKKTGWQMPETFTVKAADGVTDLYGNMWKPFDFDPKKKYPIIAHVYPGPQTEGVTHRFAAYSTNMQMAQLGFIVIQVGHRGGSPERSKAYHRSATSTCATTGWWTRRPRSRLWPRGTRSSTSTGWASTATPAADSCPPRPCCRSLTTTSSRPRSPAPATTTTTSTTTTGPSATTA